MRKSFTVRPKIVILAGLTLVMAVLLWLPGSDAGASVSASLFCEPAFDGAWCEAQPQGSGYSYGWSTTGYLRIPSPCSGPICQVSCWGGGDGGTVTVTVTAPDNSSDSASRWVECTGDTESF